MLSDELRNENSQIHTHAIKRTLMSSSPSSHNEVQLSKDFLLTLLVELSVLVIQEFGPQFRLFIHGGAVMILALGMWILLPYHAQVIYQCMHLIAPIG
jgi:hypothetical protein